MTLSIDSIRKATSGEWDRIWQECDYATFFHSREWAELWASYTDGRMQPCPILITFSDTKEALLPLTRQSVRKGFATIYFSSPAETFGGWISTNALEGPHCKILTKYFIRNVRNFVWRINPYVESTGFSLIRGLGTIENDATQVLYLEQGFQTILKGWTKGHASAVRKARREGVMVRVATTWDDWHSYFIVYEDSLRRWGEKSSRRYGVSLFDDMFTMESCHVKLWLAMYGDKVIAGALCFYSKRHVVYWHGAALEEYFSLRPVNLLLYEIIKDACDKNYVWFDFNPSGGHEGVRSFKKSFGTVSLPCPVISRETVLLKTINKLVSSIR